jgi:2-oxoglutarate ferredoxin oxidoreductase subunit gamma
MARSATMHQKASAHKSATMYEEVVFAGFGGQGILFAAEVLAYAAMIEGREVAWIPSYGPEMRGGTASATVVIGDREIGSLVVTHPGVVAAMNQPSFDRYSNLVKRLGLIVWNSSLIAGGAARTDIRSVSVPATDIASNLGNDRLANMVMLGTVIGCTKLVRVESVTAALEKMLPASKAHLLSLDEIALRKGLLPT